jgi:hypothetical protein
MRRPESRNAHAVLFAVASIILGGCGQDHDRTASSSAGGKGDSPDPTLDAGSGPAPLYKNQQALRDALAAALLATPSDAWPSSLPIGMTNLGQYNVSNVAGVVTSVFWEAPDQDQGPAPLELWQRQWSTTAGSRWQKIADVADPQPTDDSFADLLDAYGLLGIDIDGSDPHLFGRLGVVLDASTFYVVSASSAEGRSIYGVTPVAVGRH